MAASAIAQPAMSPSHAGVVADDPEDSNISSPLSEVDDVDDVDHKDINDRDIDMNLQDDPDDEKASSLSPGADLRQDPTADASDSESALSDVRSVPNSDPDADADADADANDTEAETERLYDTPRVQRQRDVVVDQFNTEVFDRTPTKLRRAAAADQADDDDESLSGDGVLSTYGGSDADGTPTKPTATKDISVDDAARLHSLERKRKRSLATETSESDQPLRKRTGSVAAPTDDADTGREKPTDQDEAASSSASTSANLRTGTHSPVEDYPEKQDAEIQNPRRERETRATKNITRNHIKSKSGVFEAEMEAVADADVADVDGRDGGADDEAEHHSEVPDVEAEEEAEAAAKNAEELARKQSAFTDWSNIEGMFGVFRERLYKDRLQRLEQEEQSLLADEPTHPEYLNMKQCLDDRLNQKLEEINKEHELRMQANERRAVAVRAQIWSQYYQGVRERREGVLQDLNKEWYDVQAARRSAHSLQDCGILFPKDPTQRVKNAVAYNTEVSTLAGIAKYEGFPAGPEMAGASASELADDLDAIQLSRRQRQQRQLVPREEYQTPTFNRLGPAGEQFLKETPWANPNHSAHKAMYQQAPGQRDGRAEAALLAGRGQQQVPTPSTAASTIEAPLSLHLSPTVSHRLTESPELARSVMKVAAPIKKTGNLPTVPRGKTAAV